MYIYSLKSILAKESQVLDISILFQMYGGSQEYRIIGEPVRASPIIMCSWQSVQVFPHTSVKEMDTSVLIHSLTVFSDFRKCFFFFFLFFFVVVVVSNSLFNLLYLSE